MAVTRRTLRLLRQLSVSVGSEVDDSTRKITAAWVRAWDELAPAWREAVADLVAQAATTGQWPAPWQLARMNRLASATLATGQALTSLSTQVGVTVAGGTGTIVAVTAAAEPGLIASQLPAATWATAAARYAANILPSALDLIVARTTEQITALTRPLSDEAAEAIRRSLVRGIAVGDNPTQTARNMLARVEGGFNGGLTRALTIARTEQLDAYRETSRHAHTANADVLSSWTWQCACDRRSCPACWAMHGRSFPVDAPGPLGHQSCRCARLPKTKTWRELGIDLDEPADLTVDPQARFSALPAADQRAVMGPTRLAMLRSGRADWDDLAVLHSTAGWRNSYRPRSVRDLQRIADRRTQAA